MSSKPSMELTTVASLNTKGGRPVGSISLSLEDRINVCVASSKLGASLNQGKINMIQNLNIFLTLLSFSSSTQRVLEENVVSEKDRSKLAVQCLIEGALAVMMYKAKLLSESTDFFWSGGCNEYYNKVDPTERFT
jgi:hypothetical protein